MTSQLSKAEKAQRVFYYNQFRAKRPDQPRLSLWMDALRHMHFREELSASVKRDKQRAKAAKKGWKTRRQNMAA
jgi:hypothetical protein